MKTLPYLLILVAAAGCAAPSGTGSIVNYKGIDGKIKQIDTTEKSYQQICQETFGTWMSAEDGMLETRNGKVIGTEPCDGCMTDSSNMFCNQYDYVNAIKAG